MNQIQVCRVEIDNGEYVDRMIIDDEKPFVLIYPSNAGNIEFFDIDGNRVEPMQRRF